jgi:hypothetical protein
MALSKEDLDLIVATLKESGVTVPAPPPPPSVHPAAAMATPVENLLDRLRLQPGPDAIAAVDAWLVEQGYEEAPPEPQPDAQPLVPGTPEYDAAMAYLDSQKPAPPVTVDPDKVAAYEPWLASQTAATDAATTALGST